MQRCSSFLHGWSTMVLSRTSLSSASSKGTPSPSWINHSTLSSHSCSARQYILCHRCCLSSSNFCSHMGAMKWWRCINYGIGITSSSHMWNEWLASALRSMALVCMSAMCERIVMVTCAAGYENRQNHRPGFLRARATWCS